ncbi:MAG: HAD-IA family hydrolase [Ferrovum myxofaciens]|uniref:HAD family hydrolase n=1 Tax=Ferrovum myxofaciens TaxID=416213 RepID=UPI002353F268|nr:HAD-IA family hydrolase [Ferrovum myxofaciens]QKE40931.1 MAG: HAD-IA family hydrolase [Ferrovum myxofaciens]
MAQGVPLPRLIMFDLDGTLVDTAMEIAHSVNQTLAEAGFDPLPPELIREWIGKGTAWLFATVSQQVTGQDKERASQVYDQFYPHFLQVYHDLTGLHSRPYPGAPEALEILRAAGCQLAVVTNKDRDLSQRLLDSQGLAQAIDILVGGGDTPEGKPSPQPIQKALVDAGLSAQDALFVGDSSNDVQAARRAGVTVWAFNHGYNHGEPIVTANPDRVLDSFPELLQQLGVRPPLASPSF